MDITAKSQLKSKYVHIQTLTKKPLIPSRVYPSIICIKKLLAYFTSDSNCNLMKDNHLPTTSKNYTSYYSFMIFTVLELEMERPSISSSRPKGNFLPSVVVSLFIYLNFNKANR